MRYLSVCSGIEAATAAWHGLGWEPAALSEIEPFPRAVLQHHYPNTPLHGDFTTIGADEYGTVDLIVGGTPCQSFSVAGLRGGLDDERGNLCLEFVKLVDRKRPRWVLWENVPGVLSSNGGRDFGAFLGALVQLGYGTAYRVLDAQYFGVPQRRRRVFVVGYLGDWRRSAAVLFERQSLRRDPPPSRKEGQGVAGTLDAGIARRRGNGQSPGSLVTPPITTKPYADNDGREGLLVSETLVPMTLAIRGRGDGRNLEYRQDGVANAVLTPNGGRDGMGVGAVAFDWQSGGDARGLEPKPTAQLQKSQVPALAIQGRARGDDGRGYERPEHISEVASTLDACKQDRVWRPGMHVRRLTPTECERLQGFPDNYTCIPWRGKAADRCPDGPRYKALGNSMAVPVMRWIGERINNQEKEREDRLEEEAKDFMGNTVDYGAHVL